MKYVLGIDVGGSKIAAGLVDRQGRVSQCLVFKTSKNNLADQLTGIVLNFKGFTKVGIGMPGQINSAGKVIHLANIPKFRQVNFKKLLEQRTNKKIFLENDAKCFAYAEAVKGAGRKYSSVAGLILGTGVGVGLVQGKRVYRGADGLAGEFGQFPMLDGKTLEKHVKSAGRFSNASEAQKYLSLLLAYITLSFNPEIIVLGGAWSKIRGMAKVSQKTLGNLMYPNKTKVVVSKLAHAGVVGAALIALKK
jgi:predicted NBD/HSP70 family sugar kinase